MFCIAASGEFDKDEPSAGGADWLVKSNSEGPGTRSKAAILPGRACFSYIKICKETALSASLTRLFDLDSEKDRIPSSLDENRD